MAPSLRHSQSLQWFLPVQAHQNHLRCLSESRGPRRGPRRARCEFCVDANVRFQVKCSDPLGGEAQLIQSGFLYVRREREPGSSLAHSVASLSLVKVFLQFYVNGSLGVAIINLYL